VIDNASTDRSGEIAYKAGATVVKEKRQGVARARLTGFKQASGDILAYTDADCIADEGWLKIISKAFSNEKVVAINGRVYMVNMKTKDYEKHDNAYWKFYHPLATKINKPIFWGANFAAKKSSLKEKYFPTHLVTYEDLEIARKLAKNKKQGEKILYLKDANEIPFLLSIDRSVFCLYRSSVLT